MTLLFVACGHDNIDLAYFGPRLSDTEQLSAVAQASLHGRHENQLDDPPVHGLMPQLHNGLRDAIAMELIVGGEPVAARFALEDVGTDGPHLSISWVEQRTGLRARMDWDASCDPAIGVRLEVAAEELDDIVIVSAPPLVIPLPHHISTVTSFGGRWANEMQADVRQLQREAIEMRSIGGKPGFDPGNWLIFDDHAHDICLGVHCGSLDDQITRCALDQEGRPFLSVEAVLPAGGQLLSSKDALSGCDFLDIACVTLVMAASRNDLAHKYHHHIRTNILPSRATWPERKVHINSWEAVGFKLNEDALKLLADKSAALGCERFVLDDGWFLGRRSDTAGLGDWAVDEAVFPNGLQPLIAHVQDLGMDFGLWIEPEMISPDSALYRAHSDWCIDAGVEPPATERNQLVLDLCKAEVFDHLLAAIGSVLDGHDIAYLKWDHNRRIPAGNRGQGDAALRLKAEVRRRYPEVEIESCSSGGGQICLPVLRHSNRVWASDNNDAIERLRINRAWAQFLPLEIIGSHVGPSRNPITGRSLAMDFRAKVALFGHMGVEADPGAMTEKDRELLAAHIALYKQWRDVLHSGELYRLDHADPGVSGLMAIQAERSLALVAQTGFADGFNVAPIRFPGLDCDATYRVTLLEPWPRKARHYLADRDSWKDGLELSGQALARNGLALPLTHPETAWLVALKRIAG